MSGGDYSLSKSFLFFGSTLSYVFGVTLASNDYFISWFDEVFAFGLVLVFLILFFVFECHRKLKIVMFIAIFLFLGIWRFLLTIPDIIQSELSYYNGQRLKFDAVVISDVVRKNNRQNFEVEFRTLSDSDDTKSISTQIKGKVMVFARAYPEYFYGDKLALSCELSTPEPYDDFDYGRFLAKDGIYSICYYPGIELIKSGEGNFFMTQVYALRHRFAEIIDQGLSEPESGVARATILGEGKIIDEELRNSFSLSGLSHIIAISGMHITVLAAMMYFLLFWIGLNRNQVFYMSLALLLLFIAMAGAPSSAVRSGIMAGLAMFALKIGRDSNFTRIIVFTAFLQLAINPRMLRDDIGFQLSFASVLGIVYLYPIIDRFLLKIKITNKYKLRDMISVTIAAQIATSGIIAYYFGMVSALSLVANILVLWTSAFILVFLLIAMFAGLILGDFLTLLFFPVKIIIDYMYFVSDMVVAIPFSHFELAPNIFVTFAYYLLMLIFILKFYKQKRAVKF